MSDYQSVPFEFPKSHDGKYILGLDNAGIIISRRKQLGFTQEQVAKRAGVKLSQYQRFESGERDISNSAMRTGLAICTVLLLDPYIMAGVNVKQPEPESLKPQPTFDMVIPEGLFVPKRAGRKQIRRDIMKVYLNYMDYSILVPYEILERIGLPEYIQLLWKMSEKRIAISAATAEYEEAIDIPGKIFEQSLLALPTFVGNNNPFSVLNMGNSTYCVEARLVKDQEGRSLILIDLNTAIEVEKEDISGAFMVPKCFREEEEDDFCDDEE